MIKSVKLRSFSLAVLIFCFFAARPCVAQPGDAAHIQYGAHVQGWIQPVGERDVYTFDGDIGDVVMIRMAEVSTSLQPMIWFYGPSNTFLDSVSSGESAIIEDYILGSVGIHTIYCTDRGANDSGEYRLKLLCRNKGGTAISYGDWRPATLDRGDIDAYRFEGQAGDVVMIRMAEAEETLPLQPVISLYGPGGGLLAIDSANGDHSVSIVDHTLTVPGTHAVFCDDENGDDSGDYCMKLLSRNYERDNATKISYADTLVDTLRLGDVNAYAFEGRIGDTVIISMAEEAGEFEPWISLYDPNAELLDTVWDSQYATLEAESLNMSGTYTIYCDDYYSNDSGEYALELLSADVVAPEFDPTQRGWVDVPIDENIRGTLSEQVRPATVNDTTFFVRLPAGEVVAGSIIYIPGTTSLEFDPDSLLPPYTLVTATLSDGLKDRAGNRLDTTYEWSFVTGPGVYPGDTNNDGIVNEVDVLPLGVFWSYAGQNRDSTGIHWRIKPVKVPWVPVAATYADADGNGQVDLEDLKAVSSNWHKTHPYPNPVFVPGDLDSLVTDNPYMDAFEELYDSLRCEEPGTGDKVREMMETILTPTQTIGGFGLSQNFPNPFNPQTEIRYVLPKDTEVELTIYNILGERIRTLVSRFQTAGLKRVRWDGTSDGGELVASGIYFCRIKAGEFDAHKKMLLLK